MSGQLMSHNDHIHDHIRADSPKSSPEPGPQHTHEKKSQLKYESQDTREARNEDEAENEAEDDLKVDAEADGSGDAVPKTDGALRFQTLAARPRLRGVSGKLAAALGTSNSPAKNRQLRMSIASEAYQYLGPMDQPYESYSLKTRSEAALQVYHWAQQQGYDLDIPTIMHAFQSICTEKRRYKSRVKNKILKDQNPAYSPRPGRPPRKPRQPVSLPETSKPNAQPASEATSATTNTSTTTATATCAKKPDEPPSEPQSPIDCVTPATSDQAAAGRKPRVNPNVYTAMLQPTGRQITFDMRDDFTWFRGTILESLGNDPEEEVRMPLRYLLGGTDECRLEGEKDYEDLIAKLRVQTDRLELVLRCAAGVPTD